MSIIIESEEGLYRAIQTINSGEWYGEDAVEFSNYPRFSVTLKGERFGGGVPARVMPALLGLQRTIDQSVAQIMGLKRLPRDLLHQTEVVVLVEDGSSKFIAELAPIFNNLVGRMTGAQSLCAILGLSAIICSSWVFEEYLDHRYKMHEMHQKYARESEDRALMQEIFRLKDQAPIVDQLLENQNKTVSNFLKVLRPEDELLVNGASLIDGETARKLVRKPQEKIVEDRMDGIYLITEVASGNVRDGYRIKAKNIKDGEELAVNIPGGTLSPEQIKQLQAGEWGKKPLQMKINVKRQGKRIKSATLSHAGLSGAE